MGSKKKCVTKTKDAFSRHFINPSLEPGPSNQDDIADSVTLARFIECELDEDYHRLVATSFAGYIKGDSDAKIIDIDNILHFFGYKTKQNVVELLQKLFPSTTSRSVDIEGDDVYRSGKSRIGRKKTTYLISFDQFEELLLADQTPEGATARKAVLAVKKAVFKYIKLEKDKAEKKLEEQMSELAIKDERLEELEGVQTRLHATLEAERARQVKKEARKAQQKTPLEKNYLLSNSPGSVGPFKLGKTGSDGKKRAKEMQTGNHERLTVVFEIACTDSYLIEKAAQHIFYDYRINDKLEWFDAPKDSLVSVLTYLVETIDGLRRMDHDEIMVDEPLRAITEAVRSMEGKRRTLPFNNVECTRLERWIVEHLRNGTLPPKILSKQLAEELSHSKEKLTANWVTAKIRPYKGRGVEYQKNQVTIYSGLYEGRGRGYHMNARELSKTFIELGLMTRDEIVDDEA